MTLRKWRTSLLEMLVNSRAIESINQALYLSPANRTRQSSWVVLGTTSDSLFVATPELALDIPPTKRSVSSVIARTFDIMGWHAPALLLAKILLQELWRHHLDWDEVVPDCLQEKWKAWLEELPLISQHPELRHVRFSDSPVLSRSLHGYSDASTKAHGGAVYLRTILQDSTVE